VGEGSEAGAPLGATGERGVGGGMARERIGALPRLSRYWLECR
jgi:hypothetical protein